MASFDLQGHSWPFRKIFANYITIRQLNVPLYWVLAGVIAVSSPVQSTQLVPSPALSKRTFVLERIRRRKIKHRSVQECYLTSCENTQRPPSSHSTYLPLKAKYNGYQSPLPGSSLCCVRERHLPWLQFRHW